jgi:MFS transporter, SP family, general alpha glucoside:H+ symporter
MAFLGTVLSWFLLAYFGRRTLYIAGEALLFLVLIIVGILSSATSNAGSLWAQAGFTMFWLFVYSMSVGPIAYAVISETSSVRPKDMGPVLGTLKGLQNQVVLF